MNYRIQAALHFMGHTIDPFAGFEEADSPKDAEKAFKDRYRGKTAQEAKLSTEASSKEVQGLSHSACIIRVEIHNTTEYDPSEAASVTGIQEEPAEDSTMGDAYKHVPDQPLKKEASTQKDVKAGFYVEPYVDEEPVEPYVESCPVDVDLKNLWTSAPRMQVDDTLTREVEEAKKNAEQLRKYGASHVLPLSRKDEDPFTDVGSVTRRSRIGQFDETFDSLIDDIERAFLD